MKRKLIITFLLIIAALFSLWRISESLTFQFAGEIISNVRITDSLIALTLDNGPLPKYTEEVLTILKNHDIPATFFLNGREMEKHPGQAKRIVQAGHQLGNHGYSHEPLMLKSIDDIRNEINRTDAAIRLAGYADEIFVRPPYGKKLFILPWLLAREDRITVTWDIYPESDKEVASDANKIADHIIRHVKPGSIILLHVITKQKEECRKSLPIFINKLQEMGYKFVTVSELTNAKK